MEMNGKIIKAIIFILYFIVGATICFSQAKDPNNIVLHVYEQLGKIEGYVILRDADGNSTYVEEGTLIVWKTHRGSYMNLLEKSLNKADFRIISTRGAGTHLGYSFQLSSQWVRSGDVIRVLYENPDTRLRLEASKRVL
jgi:hypothetical protein